MKKAKILLVVTLLIAMLGSTISVSADELFLTKTNGWHTLFNNGYKKGSTIYSVKCRYHWDTTGSLWWKKEGINKVEFTKYKNKKKIQTKTYETKEVKENLSSFCKAKKISSIYNNYKKMEGDLIDIAFKNALAKKNSKAIIEQVVDKKTNKIYRTKLYKGFLKTVVPDIKSGATSIPQGIIKSTSKLCGLTLDIINAYESGKNLADAYKSSMKTFIDYGNKTLGKAKKAADKSIEDFANEQMNQYNKKQYSAFKKKATKRAKTGSKYLYNIYKAIK